jgi:mono/diheme cytochrome c family protein
MTHEFLRRWLLAVGSSAVLAGGCSSAPAGAQQSSVAEAKQQPGTSVYKRSCAGCHGDNGEGVSSMPAVMSGDEPGTEALGRFQTAAELFAYVSKEMPLPKAKAGSLSAEDYWAVVNFLLVGHGSALPEGGVNEANAGSVQIKPRK